MGGGRGPRDGGAALDRVRVRLDAHLAEWLSDEARWKIIALIHGAAAGLVLGAAAAFILTNLRSLQP